MLFSISLASTPVLEERSTGSATASGDVGVAAAAAPFVLEVWGDNVAYVEGRFTVGFAGGFVIVEAGFAAAFIVGFRADTLW